MRIVKPEPLKYENGRRAVMLLHSFTGTVRDVKPLAQYLYQHEYTVHVPSFEGHGMGPSELVRTGPSDWWQNVMDGYHALKDEGYENIAVGGVSLGGVLSLRAAEQLGDINGVVSMSVPQGKDVEDINRRVLSYTKNFLKFTGEDDEKIKEAVEYYRDNPMDGLEDFRKLIDEVHGNLEHIDVPVAVKYGGKDAELYMESAKSIYESIGHSEKGIQSYANTGHLMTRGKDQKALFEDIRTFFDALNWQ